MDFALILVIGIGLSMDALAVSITSGLAMRVLRIRYALRIALFFGFFQAIMPVFGWLAGYNLKEWIEGLDHWVAFSLLTYIGGKMIYESIHVRIEERPCAPMNMYRLLVLSMATSMDALAVGLTLSVLQVEIITPALIIGVITFVLSFIGVLIGNRVGHFFENKIEFAGGILLILIGLNILLEHTLNIHIF